jgi:hypothetical protein
MVHAQGFDTTPCDSPDELRSGFMNPRTRSGKKCEIIIERVEACARSAGPSVKVTIDDRQAGYFVGNEPLSLELGPGEHTVTACFDGKTKIALSLCSAPGESVSLICGCRTEWLRFAVRQRRCFVVVGVLGYVIASVGWMLFPIFRDGLASTVIHLRVDGAMLWLVYATVGNRIFGSAILFILWVFPLAGIVMVWSRRASTRLKAEVGDAYFLRERQL